MTNERVTFNKHGLLPKGDYVYTFDELHTFIFVNDPKKQHPMWHKYRVEFYPHYGQNSGITDRHGNPELFPAAFRKCRTTNREKGIIKIVK
jgi:hypothetical protein